MVERVSDVRGLKCPLPVLRARKLLAGMAPGEVLRLLSDDPVAVIDLPHFCAEAGHDLVGTEAVESGGTAYLIRRGAA